MSDSEEFVEVTDEMMQDIIKEEARALSDKHGPNALYEALKKPKPKDSMLPANNIPLALALLEMGCDADPDAFYKDWQVQISTGGLRHPLLAAISTERGADYDVQPVVDQIIGKLRHKDHPAFQKLLSEAIKYASRERGDGILHALVELGTNPMLPANSQNEPVIENRYSNFKDQAPFIFKNVKTTKDKGRYTISSDDPSRLDIVQQWLDRRKEKATESLREGERWRSGWNKFTRNDQESFDPAALSAVQVTGIERSGNTITIKNPDAQLRDILYATERVQQAANQHHLR